MDDDERTVLESFVNMLVKGIETDALAGFDVESFVRQDKTNLAFNNPADFTAVLVDLGFMHLGSGRGRTVKTTHVVNIDLTE